MLENYIIVIQMLILIMKLDNLGRAFLLVFKSSVSRRRSAET